MQPPLVVDVVDESESATLDALRVTVSGHEHFLVLECLHDAFHLGMSLDDATRKIEAWRQSYNEVRPHSALDWAKRRRICASAAEATQSEAVKEADFPEPALEGSGPFDAWLG